MASPFLEACEQFLAESKLTLSACTPTFSYLATIHPPPPAPSPSQSQLHYLCSLIAHLKAPPSPTSLIICFGAILIQPNPHPDLTPSIINTISSHLSPEATAPASCASILIALNHTIVSVLPPNTPTEEAIEHNLACTGTLVTLLATLLPSLPPPSLPLTILTSLTALLKTVYALPPLTLATHGTTILNALHSPLPVLLKYLEATMPLLTTAAFQPLLTLVTMPTPDSSPIPPTLLTLTLQILLSLPPTLSAPYTSPILAHILPPALISYPHSQISARFGNWVTDTKSSGAPIENSTLTIATSLSLDPQVIRRRGAALLLHVSPVLPKDYETVATIFDVVEVEFQEHIIKQCFPSLKNLVVKCADAAYQDAASPSLLPLLLAAINRGLFSDNPVVRRDFIHLLANTQTLGFYNSLTPPPTKSATAKASKNPKHTKTLPPISVANLPPTFLTTVLIPALASLQSGPTSTHHPVGGDVMLSVQTLITTWLAAPSNNLKDILSLQLLTRLPIHFLRSLIAAYAAAPQTTLDITTLAEFASIVATLIWTEGKGHRDAITASVALLLSKMVVTMGKGTSATDVLVVLKLFPKPTSNPPLPMYDDLTAFLNNLPNGFAKNAPAAFAGMFCKSSMSDGAHCVGLLAFLTRKGEGGGSASVWPSVIKHWEKAVGEQAPAAAAVRAVELLISGAACFVVGGMGSGDVIEMKDKSLMAPPVEIENVLANVCSYFSGVLRDGSFESKDDLSNSTSCCADAESLNMPGIVSREGIVTLCKAFPNSNVVEAAVTAFMEEAVSKLETVATGLELVKVFNIVLTGLRAAPYTGYKPSSIATLFDTILKSEYVNTPGKSEQIARSYFVTAKYGCLELLAKMDADSISDAQGRAIVTRVKDDILNVPGNVLPIVFNLVASIAECFTSIPGDLAVEILEEVLETMFAIVEEEQKAWRRFKMVEVLVRTAFNPALLKVPEFFGALRKVLERVLNRPKMPLLTRVAVMYLTNGLQSDGGAHAIAWRDVLYDMIIHKELVVHSGENSMLNCDEGNGGGDGSVDVGDAEPLDANACMPDSLPATSLTRAFALHFLDALPSVDFMEDSVREELAQYLLVKLLKHNSDPKNMQITMAGTHEYCVKLRSWQALCLLTEYAAGIEETVQEMYFTAIKCYTHGSIRYYMECFGVKCLRLYPGKFGTGLLGTLRSIDCAPQVQSSLLIITGYGIVGGVGGKKAEVRKHVSARDVVQAVTPWLGSTQGFSRGVAQLLLHRLIPELLEEKGTGDKYYLEGVYGYLEKNAEMVKLRNKSLRFFDKLDVDALTTLGGILGVSHDDQEDPLPATLVDALKDSMKELYEESHIDHIDVSVPLWKRVEEMKAEGASDGEESDEEGFETMQRKILPFDALNIATASHEESKLMNAAGAKKHDLILCASLIDKAPNLGGLCRTVEIFAMKRLVLPDKTIKKMDNFKATSVAAEQWVDMEECREQVSGGQGGGREGEREST